MKNLLCGTLILSLAITTSAAPLANTVKEPGKVEAKTTLSCDNSASSSYTSETLKKYRQAKTAKHIIQASSLDLDGDGQCDLLVEYQEDVPNCSPEAGSSCDQFRQVERTDFYIAKANGEYTSPAASVERDRWTSGGRYTAYTLEGTSPNIIVWDLRGSGRKSHLADSYTIFQWTPGIRYLDPYNTYQAPLSKEEADAVFATHEDQHFE